MTIFTKRALALGSLLTVVAFGTSFTAFAQPPAGGVAPKHGKRMERNEKHPEIRKALRNLEQAKNNMEHAADDFGGHKAKALELSEQAISELKLALAADKK